MTVQVNVAYWVTSNLSLNDNTVFLRANAIPKTTEGAQFIEMWRVQCTVSKYASFSQGVSDEFKNLQLYSVEKGRLIDADTTLAQQNFSDGEVLIILPDCSESFRQVVANQEFPTHIGIDMVGANTSLTWKEICKMQSDAKNTVNVTFGPGSTFTGSFAVGDTISQAYNASSATSNDELRQHLESQRSPNVAKWNPG